MRLPALLVTAALAVSAAAEEPRAVTLDVKDAEARVVLKSLQQQCAIRNMIIDPDVQRGSATFYFRDLPCDRAFDAVLRTYGLRARFHENSVVTVDVR